MGLDNLNSQLDREPDGFFDFIDGVTVMVDRGKIIFPEIEPFGSHLRKMINDPVLASKYVFQELYDSTQTVARQMAEKNKFKLTGQYSSEGGSDIRLNASNIPQGSVKVTAGGVPLTENTDYTVDYNMGTVTIINSALLNHRLLSRYRLRITSFSVSRQKRLSVHISITGCRIILILEVQFFILPNDHILRRLISEKNLFPIQSGD